MITGTNNRNLVKNSNQPQQEQTQINNELKINKMKTTKENLVNNLNQKIKKTNELEVSKNFHDLWWGLGRLTPEEFDVMILRILFGYDDEDSFGNETNRGKLISFLNRIEEKYKQLEENSGLSKGNGWFGKFKIEGIRGVLDGFIENELENYEEGLENEMKEFIEDEIELRKKMN